MPLQPQTTGIPATNPPSPGDLQSLADVPQNSDNYDVVLGGTGFMLYRGEDDSPPSEIYKTEPADYTYSPTFIERVNQTGDLGDNQQDFYMTFVQRDWSAGMGQKWFRQGDPMERMFWDGQNINCTTTPGEVKLSSVTTYAVNGGTYSAPSSTTGAFQQVLFYTRGANTIGTEEPDRLVALTGTNGSAVVYTVNGVTQHTSGAPIMQDMTDAVIGEDGNIYVLEGNVTGTTSKIHRIGGPHTGATLAWDNSTGLLGSTPCNCITYWGGSLYVGDQKGRLRWVSSFGSVAAQTTLKDFGGGTIIQILGTPLGIFVLYYSSQGDYHLYLYDGSNTTEVARLPRGWRYHPCVEQQVLPDFQFPSVYCQHVMCYQDGVLYVAGLLPSKDEHQSMLGSAPYRQALWYWASGNTGIIWAAENPYHHYLTVGGSGPIQVIQNGLIAFGDPMGVDSNGGRLMAYDPATGGVEPIGYLGGFSQSSFFTGTASGCTVSGNVAPVGFTYQGARSISAYSGSAQVLTVAASVYGLYKAGDVFTISGVKVMLVNGIGTGATAKVIQYIEGSGAGTLVSGATVTITHPAIPPICQFAYDMDDNLLAYSGLTSDFGAFDYDYNYDPQGKFWVIPLRWVNNNGTSVKGTLVSSQFDFNSSLTKYFKDVMWDGAVKQFTDRSNAPAETTGTVDLYYVADDMASLGNSAAWTLIQSAATPGVRYPVNVSARSLSIVAVLTAPGVSNTISVGPIVRRFAVRGVPIQQGYRQRKYAIALFNDLPLKNGLMEPNTAADLRAALEALIQANAPFLVSDASMTNVSCVFEPDQCKVREVRPDEWVAYSVLREV